MSAENGGQSRRWSKAEEDYFITELLPFVFSQTKTHRESWDLAVERFKTKAQMEKWPNYRNRAALENKLDRILEKERRYGHGNQESVHELLGKDQRLENGKKGVAQLQSAGPQFPSSGVSIDPGDTLTNRNSIGWLRPSHDMTGYVNVAPTYGNQQSGNTSNETASYATPDTSASGFREHAQTGSSQLMHHQTRVPQSYEPAAYQYSHPESSFQTAAFQPAPFQNSNNPWQPQSTQWAPHEASTQFANTQPYGYPNAQSLYGELPLPSELLHLEPITATNTSSSRRGYADASSSTSNSVKPKTQRESEGGSGESEEWERFINWPDEESL